MSAYRVLKVSIMRLAPDNPFEDEEQYMFMIIPIESRGEFETKKLDIEDRVIYIDYCAIPLLLNSTIYWLEQHPSTSGGQHVL